MGEGQEKEEHTTVLARNLSSVHHNKKHHKKTMGLHSSQYAAIDFQN